MSYNSLAIQIQDLELSARCNAAAEKEAWNNVELGATDFGKAIRQNEVSSVQVFMWPLCCATEAAYEYALNLDPPTPHPGEDPTVITDADILACVQTNWPQTWPPTPVGAS